MARGTLIAANIGAIILAAAAFYVLAERQHAEREALRHAAVDLTPACRAKLDRYGLAASDVYRSPYLKQPVTARGYGEADVRAIQRGCNIVDDMQGELAATGDRERWNAKRFSRSHTASCDHCHQSLGDKQDAEGNRLVGSKRLAAGSGVIDRDPGGCRQPGAQHIASLIEKTLLALNQQAHDLPRGDGQADGPQLRH